jgi:uncharacterized protein YdhG (YjbR/CyaY superfamily)
VSAVSDADARKQIDEYIAALPDEKARTLGKLRAVATAAAPDAVETIAYSMPALQVGKHVLIYYAAFKNHLSLFPATGSLMEKVPELREYFSGKGTFQFTPDRPLPDDVVRQIVKIRRADIEAGSR